MPFHAEKGKKLKKRGKEKKRKKFEKLYAA